MLLDMKDNDWSELPYLIYLLNAVKIVLHFRLVYCIFNKFHFVLQWKLMLSISDKLLTTVEKFFQCSKILKLCS